VPLNNFDCGKRRSIDLNCGHKDSNAKRVAVGTDINALFLLDILFDVLLGAVNVFYTAPSPFVMQGFYTAPSPVNVFYIASAVSELQAPLQCNFAPKPGKATFTD